MKWDQIFPTLKLRVLGLLNAFKLVNPKEKEPKIVSFMMLMPIVLFSLIISATTAESLKQ